MVQGQEALNDFGVGDVGGPAVGGEDGFVQFAMSVGEPLRAGVVEVGERAFFLIRLRLRPVDWARLRVSPLDRERQPRGVPGGALARSRL